MESLLWALDLLAVSYLCLWALRTDKAEAEAEAKAKTDAGDKPAKPRQGSKNA
ncbi:hypothetical protein [Massilia sp.]|uniref:hypothetical protein n=1 Tax=Massilia sp. TaxID=1882437 RepID=UPI00391BB39A